jgi:uncharacterized membrane protein YgcG
MAKKILSLILSVFVLLISPRILQASTQEYLINSFNSQITVNQDTSLSVTEEIVVNFNIRKHGIIRVVPTIYSAKGRTINAKFKIISVEDESGIPYPYEKSRLRQSVKLKIGDANKTITGENTYIIKYQIKDVLLRYPTHDEVFWNVTGSEWDTTIEGSSATLDSAFAKIDDADCFSGIARSNEKNCEFSLTENSAQFTSKEALGRGKDFTVVVALNKDNSLVFPSIIEKSVDFLLDNWGYPISLLPITLMLIYWLKRGRDRRYLGDNIYFKPEKPKTKTTPLFERKLLPLVYSPIQGLTPAQVGTIIDERVDIHDVVSEIVELARLGYLKIKKIEKKGLVRKTKDYLFTKIKKDTKELKSYQKYLLANIFGSVDLKNVVLTVIDSAKTSKADIKRDEIKLSDLKNEFYTKLKGFKKTLYDNMKEDGYFAGNPEQTRIKWIGIFVSLAVAAFVINSIFMTQTANIGPYIIIFLSILPGILIARSMPRRTAWGYSLFRQIIGLKWYLQKGKWRHEIMEKNMFFEEMLPLAISLGVVSELANQMKDLNVKPPNYFAGITTTSLTNDIRGFQTSATKTLVSSPGGKWSGSSSWSGRSGFGGGGGGFSGGGFGGGGGGSW